LAAKAVGVISTSAKANALTVAANTRPVFPDVGDKCDDMMLSAFPLELLVLPVQKLSALFA
jgi:hypothetical protein